MKKLLIIPLLILLSCSNDDEPIQNLCDCELILDVVTFQFYTPDGIKYESVCIVENQCTGIREQRNKTTYNINEIPIFGTCFE